MLRTAAILFVTGFALPAIAQDKAPQLPKNSIDCTQFKKTGPAEWSEVGTAVFDLGSIKGINLTSQPVTPGYFKFGGIDVYPVLEQKCGAPAQEAPAKAEPNAAALTELAQQTDSLKVGSSQAAARAPAPPPSNDPIPAPEGKIAENRQGGPCGDRKSVYVADDLKGAAIEIVFQSGNGDEVRSGPDSEFVIRQLKNNEPGWIYKGKYRHGRFLFALKPIRERGFIPAAISFVARQDSAALVPSFIKPNRDGTGEPVLYLSGLQALFAPKDAIRRLKIEGKPPAELLPQAFYFDHCE